MTGHHPLPLQPASNPASAPGADPGADLGADHGSHMGAALHGCPDCGLFQDLAGLRPGDLAACLRCGAVLRRRRRNSLSTTLALALSGCALMVVAFSEPLMMFRLTGQTRETTLLRLPGAFSEGGAAFALLVVAVAFTTLVAPALRLGLLAFVLAGLRSGFSRRTLANAAWAAAWLKPWAMIEVFLLGLFVAYTRMASLAEARVETAVYALGGLVLVTAAAEAWLDEHAMWDAIGEQGPPVPAAAAGRMLGCETCNLAVRGHEHDLCPRCETPLERRKAQPLGRCLALVITAAVLYVPANLYPVLTVVRLGKGHPSTILGGVVELWEARMVPLAILVLAASIVVPLMKLAGLGFLLFTTWRRSRGHLLGRTRLFRVVDFVGRWSMIDVFMAAILTALVHMGVIGTVTPGLGAVFFCAVVVLTMVAVMVFDSRTMWDAAGENGAMPEYPAIEHTTPQLLPPQLLPPQLLPPQLLPPGHDGQGGREVPA